MACERTSPSHSEIYGRERKRPRRCGNTLAYQTSTQRFRGAGDTSQEAHMREEYALISNIGLAAVIIVLLAMLGAF